jgi:hypothetical protein
MINKKRRQEPDHRAVAPRIIKKAAQSLRDGITSDFLSIGSANQIQEGDARNMNWIPNNSVDLIVTSPPFLDKVDYITDNWLECWFAGVNMRRFAPKVVMSHTVGNWAEFMRQVLSEMARVLKPRSYAVVEVGEVDTSEGRLFLDEIVAREAGEVRNAGKRLAVEEVLVNQQNFTKLANCFKVDNNTKGTNTNRLVVLRCLNARGRR